MKSTNLFTDIMKEFPLVAILRGIQNIEVRDVADILLNAGFRLLEVPLNSPEPFKSIEILKKHCPTDVLVGAGTIINTEDIKKLVDIGADIAVTPNLNEDVVKELKRYEFISLIGCFSPSEIFKALSLGATGIKLFPADILDLNYIKHMRSVLPSDTKLLSVGGITGGNLELFFSKGVDGVGIGGSLYSPDYSLADIKRRAIRIKKSYETYVNRECK